ncbi:MAG: cellulose-binding protein [Polyangiaceae bacterium]
MTASLGLQRLLVGSLLPLCVALAACSSDPANPSNGAAGSGASSVAGNTGTAGSSNATAGSGNAGAPSAGSGSSTGGATTGGTGTSGSAGGGSNTGGAAGAAGAAGAGTAGAGIAGGSSADVYNPQFVEFYGADCQVADPKDVNISTLPDLFASFDGTRITKKSDWRCRRAELKKGVEKYIHGPKPGKPDTVTGSVTATSIKVHVEHMGKSIDFSVAITLPPGATGAVPAIIGLGGGSLDNSIVSGEGVASINYDNYALSSEDSAKTGLFSKIYGTTDASAQIAWAWGVSRIIDVLVAERDAGRNNIIDPTGIGVTGCSRLGKGAFTIGAFDERIALGIPQESGTAGVSALRMIATAPKGPNGQPAQSIASAISTAAGWFGVPFNAYKGKVETMPVDMSSIVAMYAPRGFLVLDNSRIGELCSTCQHAATAAGAEVYEALGIGKNIEYHGGNTTDPHDHCTFYPSQADPLKRAIRAFLTKKAAPDGRIAPAAVATADLAKWVPWTAPTLADDVSWASPPLTSK